MQSPKAPTPPDPAATAAAQTSSNVGTALAQGQLNNVNQVTPYGSLTYKSEPSPVNVGGQNIPQYTATQTLSPEQQKLYDLSTQTQANVGQIGVDQSKKIGQLLGTPVDLSPGAVDAHLTQLGLARLEPQLQRDWAARESQLMNRGIMPGSEQYALEQQAFNQSKNDAYNQLILSGYGQGQQSLLAQRNQPINEITALLSGGQVSQPNFINSNSPTMQPTNVAGIYDSAYNNQLNAYKANQSNSNAMMGGLFGLGSAGLQLFGLSDRRAKEGIKKVGRLENGLDVYSFRYKSGGPTQIGLMADEVERVHPGAVAEINGLKHVDYDMAVR